MKGGSASTDACKKLWYNGAGLECHHVESYVVTLKPQATVKIRRPALLVPGTYYVRVNNSASDSFSLAAGETKDLMLGAIRILTPEGQATAVDIYQVATNVRLGSYGRDGPVQLVPSIYYVKINNSNTEQITVESGQTTEVLLGAVHVDGQFSIYSGMNYLGHYGNTLLLAPGTYRLELDDGRTVENVEVRAGEVTEVK
jgi:hypothetical protein